jgi:Protein of unknown function (DUF3106)
MAKALLGIAFALCLAIPAALAQSSSQASPSWRQLSSENQRILAPLEGEWEKFDALRKRKWMGIAQRYQKMTVEEQERLQRRMKEWASLTPEQRRAAREKYKEFEQLPVEDRQAIRQRWDQYKQERSSKEGASGTEPASEKPMEAAVTSSGPPGAATLNQQ